MHSSHDLKAKAQALYQQAHQISDLDERLPVILRAVECEMEADALEWESETLADADVIARRRGGERA